ncbi:MAG: hypothetical protein KKA64_01980 [Nanoarchaeota archaeon]|nr:hypothetical protein [Nanoarchaeota archaeon]
MNNKKAILMPETLKILMAVICIVLLVYLFMSLTGVFTHKNQLKQAQDSLNQINLKIGGLSEIKKEDTLMITGPKDWYLEYFKNDKKICFCQEFSVSPCEEQVGVCVVVNEITFEPSCNENYPVLTPVPSSIQISQPSCLYLKAVPVELSVEKSNNQIKISVKLK